MIWAKEETLPRSEIEAIQLAKLKESVRIYLRPCEALSGKDGCSGS